VKLVFLIQGVTSLRDSRDQDRDLLIRSYDVATLIVLLRENPSRTLDSYRRELFNATGTITSTRTLCRFWQSGFDTPASLRKPNMIPIDKFKLDNISRVIDYIQLVLSLDPRCLKFADEKSLKGAEIFNRKVRKDPLTGAVKPILTDPDFRNTCTIIGFSGVDQNLIGSCQQYCQLECFKQEGGSA